MIDKLKLYAQKSKYVIPGSTVLMFHRIGCSETKINSSTFMTDKRFRSFIERFECWSTINEAFDEYKTRKLAISFDDGYEDVYNLVFPFLTERGIPFTVFVTPELLDKTGYLSIEQLKEMSKNPLVTIGSHCLNHIPLKGMNVGKQLVELRDSKYRIEEIILKTVNVVAYPYGQYDANTIQIINENGLYQYGFSASGGPINILSRREKLALPRLRVDDKMECIALKQLECAYGK